MNTEADKFRHSTEPGTPATKVRVTDLLFAAVVIVMAGDFFGYTNRSGPMVSRCALSCSIRYLRRLRALAALGLFNDSEASSISCYRRGMRWIRSNPKD